MSTSYFWLHFAPSFVEEQDVLCIDDMVIEKLNEYKVHGEKNDFRSKYINFQSLAKDSHYDGSNELNIFDWRIISQNAPKYGQPVPLQVLFQKSVPVDVSETF